MIAKQQYKLDAGDVNVPAEAKVFKRRRNLGERKLKYLGKWVGAPSVLPRLLPATSYARTRIQEGILHRHARMDQVALNGEKEPPHTDHHRQAFPDDFSVYFDRP